MIDKILVVSKNKVVVYMAEAVKPIIFSSTKGTALDEALDHFASYFFWHRKKTSIPKKAA